MRIPEALVRWVVSAAVAGTVTTAIFLAMTRLVSGEWLLAGLLRIFPLGTSAPAVDCLELVGRSAPVKIEGELVALEEGRFVPIADGTIFAGRGPEAAPLGRTDAKGAFEIVLAFPLEAPASCRERVEAAPVRSRTITLRAPGCVERRVPVTPAWVPHQVVLDCGERPDGS